MGERHTAMIERIVRRVEQHTEEWRQRDAVRAAEAEANRDQLWAAAEGEVVPWREGGREMPDCG
jgi:hypothetical protein